MRLGPARIAAIYLVVSCFWITLSDKLLFLFKDIIGLTYLPVVNSGKGLLFVVITAILLCKLIKLSNKRLIDNEKQYRLMYEGSPLPKWIYDLQSLKFVSVNDAAVRHYGYTRQQFLGMSILDIRPPGDKEKVKESVKSVSQNIKQSGIWTHIKADGSHINVVISSQLVFFRNKQQVIVTAQDITDKMNFEQQLKKLNDDLTEQKRKLSITQQMAKVGGWEFYPESKRLVWSDEMYMITGVPRTEEQNLYDLYTRHIHPNDRLTMVNSFNRLMNNGEPFDVIHRITLLNGEIRYVRQLASLVTTGNSKVHKVIGSAQDITELKQLEQERNKYLYSFEDTLNNINEGFYALDRNMVFTKVNKRFELETGMACASVIGKQLTEAFPGVEARETYKQYQRVLNEQVSVKFEAYWRHFKKWHYVEAYPTADGIAVYFNDITEKKEKDLQLQQAIERYEIVAKATQDVIYDYDIINDNLSFNTDVTQLLQCSTSDVGHTLKWWRSLVHPDDIGSLLQSQQEVTEAGGTNWRCEYRLLCADGSYRYVYSQGYYIYNANSQPVRIIGAIKDVDELKRINDENKRLAEIITKVNNMVVLTDINHNITWVNKAFEDYTGYQLNEMRGTQPDEYLGGNKLSADSKNEVLTRKTLLQTFTVDVQHHLKHGITKWANVEYTPLFNEFNRFTGYIAVYKDITERKEREEKIYKQNKVLQEISWASSHEIRKPVASILGLTYLAKDSQFDHEKDEIIAMIDECAQELDVIVHKITDKISNELYTGRDSIKLEHLN